MTDFTNNFQATFGVEFPICGPFGKFDFDLRFELAPPLPYNRIHQFSQAYDRARALSKAAFTNLDNIQILLSISTQSSTPNAMTLRPFFEHNFSRARFSFLGSEFIERDEFGEYHWHWAAYRPRTIEEIDTFLWLTLACDIGIQPNYPARAYFVNCDQGFYLHPYDDRGMDLCSVNRDPAQKMFDKFAGWLLDYNRREMEAVFLAPHD